MLDDQTPKDGPVIRKPDPTQLRRRLLAALAVVGGVLLLLLLVDALVWLLPGQDAIAAGVYAELPSLEQPSPLAQEPVALPTVRLPLGGLDQAAATARIRQALGGEPGVIQLRDPIDDRTWSYDVGALGLVEWAPRAAEAAHAVGRDGGVAGWLERQRARFRGHRVVVPPAFDATAARRTLEDLAPEVDVAPADAEVVVEGAAVTAVPPTLGHQLDVAGTLAALAALADRPAVAVVIAIARTAPSVYDTGTVAAALDLIRSGPLSMTDRRGQSYTVDAATVASWFTLADLPDANGVSVPSIVVDREAIGAWLATLAPLVAREPTEGRYRWSDGLILPIEPPLDGYALDIDASIDPVIAAAYADPHLGQLIVTTTAPRVSGRAQEALLATSPVASAQTSLAGSPDARRQAIVLAAERLDGSALPPGGVLSLRDALGAVTADAGYDVGWLSGPRNWLDQVATTAFRAGLQAGLPIVERHAPTWRSGWHEPPVGLDAAIDALGAPSGEAAPRDLRITNDTAGWLLFVVAVDPVGPRLSWTIWGTDAPRAVRLEGPSVIAVAGVAEPLHIVEPALPAGAVVQVGWAREGAEARVARRTIVGSELREDAFESRYDPAPDVFVEASGRR